LSKRIGLRHMQSIGGKGLVCPSGEQIVNGGFETGDFTGWTLEIDGTYCSVSSTIKHSGAYSAYIKYNPCLHIGGAIKQTFSTAIQGACIESFTLWIYRWSADEITIEVGYSDGTVETWTEKPVSEVWTEVNLKAHLDLTKKVSYIQIHATGGTYYVDDISLVVKG